MLRENSLATQAAENFVGVLLRFDVVDRRTRLKSLVVEFSDLSRGRFRRGSAEDGF